jgi:pyruvate formate lyase activating enzyme
LEGFATVSTSTGCVFNIQHYSVHDGPGIRTIVFLKGCPLRCRWCCNPESQIAAPELAYNPNKCIGSSECHRCKDVCPTGGISVGDNGKIVIDRTRCAACFQCVEACPSKAMHVFGREMSVAEVIKIVEADNAFYSRSGGGLTISGGEPLMQPAFTLELIKESLRRRIDVTIETCGFADWQHLAEVARHLKLILFDIKSLNAEKHKSYTGVSNERILANFKRLRSEFPDLHILVRIPLIPGLNDTEEEIAEILGFLQGMQNITYELLPYHRMGQSKYEFLGRPYPMADVKLGDERAKALKDWARATYPGAK